MDTLNELLPSGVDIDYYSERGTTALSLASFYGRRRIVEVLLSKGVNIKKRMVGLY